MLWGKIKQERRKQRRKKEERKRKKEVKGKISFQLFDAESKCMKE